jgi:hypothetical protein
LKEERVELHDLAKVQRQRELPTRIIQAFQSLVQQRIFARVLNSQQQFQPPALLQLPFLRDLSARLIAFGILPAHVNKNS